MEEVAIQATMIEILPNVMAILQEDERKLIDALFIGGHSERKLAELWNMPRMTLSARKKFY